MEKTNKIRNKKLNGFVKNLKKVNGKLNKVSTAYKLTGLIVLKLIEIGLFILLLKALI